jgi:hypothetical protein
MSPSISRLREGNCSPFTQNGLDDPASAAPNCGMGQSNPPGRCEHCGGLMVMVLVMPPDGKASRELRCLQCDRIDPLELPSIAAWLDGELRPPK